jgi:hypothetical protein
MERRRSSTHFDQRRPAGDVMAREHHAVLFEERLVLVVELVAVAVPFADVERPVGARGQRSRLRAAVVAPRRIVPPISSRLRCSGKKSMTGSGVASSTSDVIASGSPQT